MELYKIAYMDNITELAKYKDEELNNDVLDYAIAGYSYKCLEYICEKINSVNRNNFLLALFIGDKRTTDILMKNTKLPEDLEKIYNNYIAKGQRIKYIDMQRCCCCCTHLEIMDDPEIFALLTGNIKYLITNNVDFKKYNKDEIETILSSSSPFRKIHKKCIEYLHKQINLKITKDLSGFIHRIDDMTLLKYCIDSEMINIKDAMKLKIYKNDCLKYIKDNYPEYNKFDYEKGSLIIMGGCGIVKSIRTNFDYACNNKISRELIDTLHRLYGMDLEKCYE